MEIPIPHTEFKGQNLSVKTPGFFKGACVLYNGNPVKKIKGGYHVRNNNGEEILVKLKGNFLDPIPKVVLGKETILLARPLMWYEYLWIGLPILLVFTGGAIGGMVGFLASHSSARIFRSDRSAFGKYSITALISVVAIVTYIILALIAQQFIARVLH